jgi:ketosteroid isomerase-like protein
MDTMNKSYTFNNINNHHDEIAAVEKTIKTNIGWAVDNKNKEALLSTVVDNEELFFFQPDSKSTIKGINGMLNLVDNFFMLDDFKAIKTEIKDLRIHISPSLRTAWYSCILNDYNEFKGKSANWENVRWTGVMEKIEGHWKIMQMHFSKAEDLL